MGGAIAVSYVSSQLGAIKKRYAKEMTPSEIHYEEPIPYSQDESKRSDLSHVPVLAAPG